MVAHAIASLLMASILAVLVVPNGVGVAFVIRSILVEPIREVSYGEFAIQVGLGAAVWGLVFTAFRLVRRRISERRQPEVVVVRASRGSVMAETVIILPLFLFMTFGMAQMAINNIAGMLANVASFEAARTVWVWEGEAGKRNNVTAAIVKKHARTAAALVMTPVAPGDFEGNPFLDNEPSRMRRALALSQVPFAEAIDDILPPEVLEFAAIGAATDWDFTIAVNKNMSFWRALDHSGFMIRSMKKFTHAYHASEITVIQGYSPPYNTGVDLKYHHHLAMPIVAAMFGKKKFLGPQQSLRFGHYITIHRTFTLAGQYKNPPNANLPDNSFVGDLMDYGAENALRSEVGFWD